jgi:hypothetical protein
MFWVWGARFSPSAQAAVFGVATVWFLVEALQPTHGDGTRQPKQHAWFRAASMGAMLWMAYLMAIGGAHQKIGARLLAHMQCQCMKTNLRIVQLDSLGVSMTWTLRSTASQLISEAGKDEI